MCGCLSLWRRVCLCLCLMYMLYLSVCRRQPVFVCVFVSDVCVRVCSGNKLWEFVFRGRSVWLSISASSQWGRASAVFPPALLGWKQHAQCSLHDINCGLIKILSCAMFKMDSESSLVFLESVLSDSYCYILLYRFIVVDLFFYAERWDFVFISSPLLQVRAPPPTRVWPGLCVVCEMEVVPEPIKGHFRASLISSLVQAKFSFPGLSLAELLSLLYTLDCSLNWFRE